MRHWVLKGFAILMAAGCAGLGAVGWIASERAIHPAPRARERSLAEFPELAAAAKPFHMDADRGIRLRGYFVPGTRRATVVLSHGYGMDQRQMLPFAAFLHRAGFSTLLYDMRDRGESRGGATTLGALESRDLAAVVRALAAQADVDPERIGALGLSLGAAVSMMAAAAEPRIRAVVEDSGFTDATSQIAASFEHFIGLPAFPFAPVTVAIAGWRTGLDVQGVRPVDAAPQIAPRPLFVIHCMDDDVIPPVNGERIYAAARKPKEIWRVPSGKHAGGHRSAKEEYERRVVEFFERWIGR